jgi:site-specific DNA-methyltransferase (adenine-specific)
MVDLSSPNNCNNYVVEGDCTDVLPKLPAETFQLIYIDPPFNTGKVQRRRTLRTSRSADGDRVGFQGRRYATTETGAVGYPDTFTDYLEFVGPKLEEARRLLRPDGTLYLHLDYREAHYCKVALDQIFGRECFLNEIIWAYDYGGRTKDRWAQKHDTLLVYVKDMATHFFDQSQIDRIPYMAPGLVTPEKRALGKLPTDVWWHTIVPTNGKEKTGYPNQKPEAILRRIVRASSASGQWVLDFFAGSGTTGAVAAELGRRFVVIDVNDEAVRTMERRLGHSGIEYVDSTWRPLDREAPLDGDRRQR